MVKFESSIYRLYCILIFSQANKSTLILSFRRTMSNKQFDPEWYLSYYKDVREKGIDPYTHYIKSGKTEGRFPSRPSTAQLFWSTILKKIKRAYFQFKNIFTHVDENWYFQTYPDVAASGISAKTHYINFGCHEGRIPHKNFSNTRLSKVAITLRTLHHRFGGLFPAVRFTLGTLKAKGFIGVKQLLIDTYLLSLNFKSQLNYPNWILLNELQASDFEKAATNLKLLPVQPKISILMPCYKSNVKWLKEAIESIQIQPYSNWELCICDDASNDQALIDFLKNESDLDPRIKYSVRKENGHISAASNSAAELVTGEWIALFDHDDLLHPFALYWVVQAINNYPSAQLIYSDEDKVDEAGIRFSPYFKPDWNYDLFLAQNCFSHLGLIKTSLFNRIGGFRIGYEGSQDHDLILRAIEHVEFSNIVHIPKVLYHWRAHSESTAQSAATKPYAAIAGEKAIREHLISRGSDATVSFEKTNYQVIYEVPENQPLVSLIIPTRNGYNILKQCIDSIFQKTTYKNFEIIIVDNGSDDLEILDYFKKLTDNPAVTIIRDDRPFNYSQLNNEAVKRAKGEIVGLINNDIEVISPNWLSEMVSHAVRPGVGAVGAKLLYPDDRLQHAGVLLGVGGVANHAHLYINRKDPGYFCRAAATQNFSAVTAACLLIKKSIYLSVGGLDEVNLTVAFNDVDFCIRVRNAGFRNVWTPHALLYHHESATRGQDVSPEKRARFVKEVEYMMNTWGDQLANDPAYNPNLNIDFPDFSISAKPRVEKWSLDVPHTLIQQEQLASVTS